MPDPWTCRTLTNEELIGQLKGLVRQEKQALIPLLVHLAEFDRRKLYADLGHPSFYDYCVRALGYSEAEAAWRMRAARAARRFPSVLSLLESGVIRLPALATISAYLTEKNHWDLLKQAGGKTRREVEELVAAWDPQKGRSDYLAAFDRQRVRVGFDAGENFRRELERARQLLRHKFPAGRLEDVFSEVLEAFLERKDPERRLRAKELKGPPAPIDQVLPPIPGPEPSIEQRRIPQRVRDEVWRRDEGRCTFVGPDGRRCVERGGLEFDHIVPYALGGPSNNPRNIRLLCRTHNQLLARRVFGGTHRY